MQHPAYTLGLDIGIASVGAALLTENQIIGMHVRTFDAAEHPKTGESLNLTRRKARSVRRRLRRRAFRLKKLCRLFKRAGLTESSEPQEFHLTTSPWQLRAEGLDRQLTNKEWASVLYHLLKHRGFQSNRKSEAKADQKAGEMLKSVEQNQQKLKDGNYRTIGEMVWKSPDFSQARRNKGGKYQNTIGRSELLHEMNALFIAQAGFGNTATQDEFKQQVTRLMLARRPVFKDDDIATMVGHCTFEPNELRAAKSSYSAERFVWLGKLNNLRLVYPGENRPLSTEQMDVIRELPFQQGSIKFSQIRKKLDLPEHVRFNLLRYNSNEDAAKTENKVLFEAKAFHAMRKAYEEHELRDEWKKICQQPHKLDAIASAITLYRDDDRIRTELQNADISTAETEAVLSCQFENFIRLSLTALRKILPFMEQGLRYDEATEKAGYLHYAPQAQGVKTGRIPAPDKNIIRNPVVYRSLNQSRKLINAIVKHYGPPAAIHIEMARDLSNPLSERRSIEKEQEKYRKQKEQLAAEYHEHFGQEPNGLSLLKYRLYREQDGKCSYSQKPIELERLNEQGYLEVDHILPYSRSYDDSMVNKTLVLTAENRDKGNRTPWEYFGGDEGSQRWRSFSAWVLSNPKIRLAKRNRYLRKDFAEKAAKEFRERNLNDTRYIGRELKAMIEENINWAGNTGSERCVVLAGRLTALLRSRWGFDKTREHGDLHHAVDAAVVAATNRSMVQRMALHSRYHELRHVQNSYADPETGEVLDLRAAQALDKHFPLPWETFKQDIHAYLNPAPVQANESEQKQWMGIRVSRASTKRKLGAAHEEFIRSVGKDGILLQQNLSAIKTPLTKLTLDKLPSMLGYEDPRNAALVQAIRTRLEAFNGDGSKAFAPEQPPLYKPSKPGKTAPVVRSVPLTTTQKSGLAVRGGIANNDSMVRVDVFSKGGKYFTVPLYVADIAKSELPNRAVVAYKEENEWPVMDESYQFEFSLHTNDWLKLILRKEVFEGYFAGLDRANGSISIWAHDRDRRKGSNGLYRGIGIKTALSAEKFHVDLLGKLYKAGPEQRQPLRKGQRV